MEVLNVSLKVVRYIFNTKFRGVEKIHEDGIRQELAQSADVLVRDLLIT